MHSRRVDRIPPLKTPDQNAVEPERKLAVVRKPKNLLACRLLSTALLVGLAHVAAAQTATPPADSTTPTSAPASSGTIQQDKVDARPAFNKPKQNQPSQTPPSPPQLDTTQPQQTPEPQVESAPAPTKAPPAVVLPSSNRTTTTAPTTQPASTPPTTPPQTTAAQHPIFTARPKFALTPHPDVKVDDEYSSAYIPMDSWVYTAALRLYSLGYLDSAFLGLRPWTRRSLLHMMQRCSDRILSSKDDEAIDIYESLNSELADENLDGFAHRGLIYGMQSVYSRMMYISNTPWDNSYHLGNTIVNDYGRPYAQGFNNSTGASTLEEEGRFSLYVRAEYQHAPAGVGYTVAQAQPLANEDELGITLPIAYPITTIPIGTQPSQTYMRVVEASLSGHVLGHELSIGKNDAWLGPAVGGSWAWSNNAENIWGARIDRVEPLHIPYLSAITGPFRYEFFVGSLKGHAYPLSPYVHMEKFSFKPYSSLEIGIQRTIIWGGVGHAPVTLHTFLKSFFSFSGVPQNIKFSPADPGARYSAFDANWRLPYLEHWLTLYVDMGAHDDVNPISAPRRADFRTGLYLSHVPAVPKLDLRVEAADSDQSTSISLGGGATYWEVVQRQGYTNNGQIMGDWMGREGKGGQAWLTYHLSGNEQVQLEWMHAKNAKDFFPGGSGQNQVRASAVVRIAKQLELNGYVQYEEWVAPYWMSGRHSDTTTSLQITWYPKLHSEQ